MDYVGDGKVLTSMHLNISVILTSTNVGIKFKLITNHIVNTKRNYRLSGRVEIQLRSPKGMFILFLFFLLDSDTEWLNVIHYG